jgi:nucleoside-diphosphate-sugar epimerase
MKLIVTGGTGFIGSHFLREAVAAGHEVIAIRRPGSRPRMPLEGSITWVDSQFSDVDFKRIGGLSESCFVHLAAYGVNPANADWESSFKFNVHDSLKLWIRAIDSGITHFVICGSCFEYGNSGQRYEFIPVDAPLEPTGPYHSSKAAASMAALGLAVDQNLELKLVRPFHIYGEGEDEHRLWPALRKAALGGEDFKMTAGEQVRDFMPVEALAAFLLRTIETPTPRGSPQVLHAGAGQPQTIREFAESWWNYWNGSGKLLVGALLYRKGEVMRYVPRLLDENIRSGVL